MDAGAPTRVLTAARWKPWLPDRWKPWLPTGGPARGAAICGQIGAPAGGGGGFASAKHPRRRDETAGGIEGPGGERTRRKALRSRLRRLRSIVRSRLPDRWRRVAGRPRPVAVALPRPRPGDQRGRGSRPAAGRPGSAPGDCWRYRSRRDRDLVPPLVPATVSALVSPTVPPLVSALVLALVSALVSARSTRRVRSGQVIPGAARVPARPTCSPGVSTGVLEDPRRVLGGRVVVGVVCSPPAPLLVFRQSRPRASSRPPGGATGTGPAPTPHARPGRPAGRPGVLIQ